MISMLVHNIFRSVQLKMPSTIEKHVVQAVSCCALFSLGDVHVYPHASMSPLSLSLARGQACNYSDTSDEKYRFIYHSYLL